MMMIQNGFVMGGMLSSHDHFRDLRLNVDGMSYEVMFLSYYKEYLNSVFFCCKFCVCSVV